MPKSDPASEPTSAPPPDKELLVFPQGVEVFFKKVLADDMTPELKAALKDEGLDLDKPFLPAYPAEDMARWVKLAVTRLHPGVELQEALRRIGEQGLVAWEQTILGKASLVAMKMLGPRRTLQKLQRTFRYSDNFTEIDHQEESPTSVLLTFNHFAYVPGQRIGIIEATLVRMGLKDVSVELIEERGEGGVLRASWRE